MNILHLLSNRKWTERSEPAADLVLAQKQLGQHALLACGKWTLDTGHESSAEVQAKKKGLDPIILNLNKHFSWSGMKKDVPALAEIIDREQIDILHAHMENAHLLAALARRRSTRKPTLVVSDYGVAGPLRNLRTAVLYRKATDACTVISDQARNNILSRFPIPPASAEVIEPGIDLDRFRPDRAIEEPFQVTLPAPPVQIMGMVTRIRADRRVDLAVSALALLRDRLPHLHLLLVGHGEEEGAIRNQAAAAGVADRVIWSGYCRGEQLVLAYRAMDLLLYPVPGTDQSCRTVREALASGVPVAATRTGFLSQLVDEGTTGMFADASPDDLAEKIENLFHNASTLTQWKANARAQAERRFSLELQARKTLSLYQRLLQP